MSDPAPVIDPADARVKELFNELWNDGELGAKVRAKAKAKWDDITLPEDTLRPAIEPLSRELESTRAELKAMQEERAKEREEADKARTERNLQDMLEKARSKFNLTDDGFDKMVSRMKETSNYTDAEAAAAWVAQSLPPPKSPGPSWMPKRLDLFDGQDKEDLKLLHEDPQAYEDKQLNAFFADPDRFVQEALGIAA